MRCRATSVAKNCAGVRGHHLFVEFQCSTSLNVHQLGGSAELLGESDDIRSTGDYVRKFHSAHYTSNALQQSAFGVICVQCAKVSVEQDECDDTRSTGD